MRAKLQTSCFLIIFFISCREKETDRLFNLLSPLQTGIEFSNDVEDTPEFNIINYQDFYSGGGVSIGDINNDGLPDIFFTGNIVQNKLYLNKGGLKFQDITNNAGLEEKDYTWCTGSTMIDINNDGLLDIYVSYSGLLADDQRKNKLWINQGNQSFKDEAQVYNLDHAGYSVNANFFDYDKDGDLDMYLVNQGPEKNSSSNSSISRNKPDEFSGDKLFRNDHGLFADVTNEAGIYSALIGFGHGAAIGDLNSDGWDDIYVCNDFFEHDYLYVNNQDGTFSEQLKTSMKHISNFAMGNDMSDFNNDGLLDIVAVDMVAEDNRRQKSMLGGMSSLLFTNSLTQGYHYQFMYNTLQLNNGNMTFSEIGQLAGIAYTDWSWGPLFADFDNDGFKDLYIPNGLKNDIRNIDWARQNSESLNLILAYDLFSKEQWDQLLNSLPSEKLPNYMFRNNGDLSFENTTKNWGLGDPSFSNGASYADLDNDGDLELVVNNVDDPAFIYENLSNSDKNINYLIVKLKGPQNNLLALGTKVVLKYGDDEKQLQQQFLTRGYRSSIEPMLHFGLGKDSIIHNVEIFWPDFTFSQLVNVKTNQELIVDYEKIARGKMPNEIVLSPLFSPDSTDRGVKHRQLENSSNPFQEQALLPYKYSELGPKIAVADVNGDGLEDFFIGGAYRHPGHLYIQQPAGYFKDAFKDFWDSEKEYEDMGISFFDADNDRDQDLYIVSGGYEFAEDHRANTDRLYLNDGEGNYQKSQGKIPDLKNHGGNVLPKDYDRDGDDDLLITGRIIAGKYPLPASSYLLENQKGEFHNVSHKIAPELKNIGMATDAVWSDYDKDGDYDFLILGEWMKITVFENRENKFKKINLENGLENSSGWWNCIEKYDFDNDGDDDYIAGNLGLNYRYKTSLQYPFQVFSADFNQDKKQDIVLSYYENGILFPLENRDRSIRQVPEIEKLIPSYGEFATSSVEDIYGKDNLAKALKIDAKTFSTSMIENLGNGKFKLIPLDNHAQLSPTNSTIINDFNNDGHVDLLIAGNLYSTETETSRADAGIGLYLSGNGNGDFKPVPYVQSGFYADGDVKDIKEISVGTSKYIIVGRNKGLVSFIKVN